MKNWTWKTWVQIIVAALIFVGAIVGVIYGVVTHEEPGFVNAENSWADTPLTVGCTNYAGDSDEGCDTAEHAVSVVNTRLGFDMLRWTGADPDGDSDIHITMRAPVEVGGENRDAAGGHYELTGRAGVYEHCDVWTMNVSGPNDLEWLVLYHELGHCLGLAHDGYEQSIMYPTQEPTPDRTIPPWISDHDRNLLREKYR